MRISTRAHGILDLATVGFALAFPRLLGASDRFTRAATTLALGKLGYALLTRHELGLVKAIPMKTHLALDAAGGAAMCALPFVLEEQENPAVVACSVGMGLFDIAAAPLTDTRSLPPRIPGVTSGVTTPLPGETRRSNVIPREKRLPTATHFDSMRITSKVLVPTVAKGPIIRRPWIVGAAESMGLDTAAVKTMQRMRDKYGSGPLMLRMPLRKQAVLLDPAHVRRVLDESPEPFATASTEKQAALAHFEPKGALVSHGVEREHRRGLNERVLEADNSVHHMAGGFLPIVREEAQALLQEVESSGQLRWREFYEAWFRIVRRVVFGDGARNDRRIITLMEKLRADGNWAFLKSKRTDLRDELHRRIRGYIEKAEPGSLAAFIASTRPPKISAPANQIPQWLFAFDPAAMATFRALALLATHPHQLSRAREEPDAVGETGRTHRPFLRAAVLESLRLWPTTPMILRQTTRETEWENGIMPANTGILIFAPFFHRDETRLPFAHTFHPDVWIESDPEVKGDPPHQWPLVPFSGGTAVCPGRNVVLLLTSEMLSVLIGERSIRLKDPQRMPPGALPGTLDNYTLTFELDRIGGSRQSAMAVARQSHGDG
jgi:cytochrome P450